jgi:tetratricopeptide (TPR) repeat protein
LTTPVASYSSEEQTGASPWRFVLDKRLWLLCALFFVVSSWNVNDGILYTPDSARYLAWAQSLSSFDGYHDTTSPESTRYVVHAPLYSVLLAPLEWGFRNIVLPAKILTVFFGALIILLFYVWTAGKAGRQASFLGALLLALNPLMLVFSSQVLSDVPFVAALILVFILAERMMELPEESKFGWVFVLALTCGVFLREVGLTLLLGSAAYFFVRKRYRNLLLVCTIPVFFYMIWYFRNELLIAGVENPSLRNVKIMVAHSFTSEDSSLASEFFARLQINTIVYLKLAKGLVLFPQFLVRPYSVVSSSDPAMAVTARLLGYIQYPLIILQYGLLLWGIAIKRRDRRYLLVLFFSFFYLLMILLYPINDMRFLLPMLPPLLHLMIIGGSDLAHKCAVLWAARKTALSLLGASLVLVMIPNVVWFSNFVAHSHEYARNTNDRSREYIPTALTPELYTRPASLVGAWLADHTDSSTVVLARWKELAFWMKGRKVLDSDPLLSISLFESVLRDYNIDYIVSFITPPGIREFEFQMVQTRRFSFTPVYRAGGYEVLRVHHLYRRHQLIQTNEPVPLSASSDPTLMREATTQDLFRQGVKDLEAGRAEDAFRLFDLLLADSHGSGYIGLFRGTALEFGGNFGEAQSYFSRYMYEQQAGAFLMSARFHFVLMREMQKADQDSSKSAKAIAYHKVSANYWDNGFREHAMKMLDKSLLADPTFFPSLIFGMYYSLQLDDTARALSFFKRAERVDSTQGMMRSVRRLFSLLDSARSAASSSKRSSYELGIAQSYLAIGLTDLAIDGGLAALEDDPANTDALEVLVQAYEIKGRPGPESRVLDRLLTLRPDDQALREKLADLKNRL